MFQISNVQCISKHIERLRSYEMIPCCTVFLFTDDFTFPNKPASFVIKDADLADSAVLPFCLA